MHFKSNTDRVSRVVTVQEARTFDLDIGYV